MAELDKAIERIKAYISTEPKPYPQSVIFRSGMNTGLRIAVREIEKVKGENEGVPNERD